MQGMVRSGPRSAVRWACWRSGGPLALLTG